MNLFSFLLLLALSFGQQPADGSIAGVVLRTGTTDPIPRAEVTLGGGQTTASTLTDMDGRFFFSGLATGTYTVRIQRDGFFGSAAAGSNESVTQRLLDATAFSTGVVIGDRVSTSPTTARIELSASQHRTELAYYLTPGGILTGHVLGKTRPFPGATVTALRLDSRNGMRSLTPVKSALADDRGDFRISWLEAGEYFLRADATLPDGNVRTYFPSAESADQAVKVRVDAGRESSPFNIILAGTRAPRLSGSITNMDIVVPQSASNQRTARFLLAPVDRNRILDKSPDVSNDIADLGDRLAGKFEIRDVHPGIYDLVVMFSERRVDALAFGSGFPVYTGMTRVVVGTGDVQGIRMSVSRGREVRGHLSYVGGTALPAGKAYRVILQPAGVMETVGLSANYTAEVLPGGTFSITEAPPFSFKVIVAGLPQNIHVTDVLVQGRSVPEGIFTVGDSSVNLEILVSSD